MNEFMKIALQEANNGISKKHGGPFGAIIIKDNKIISKAHNTVLKTHDCTSHAEINAIRKASKKLKTHDLTDCILYTSAEPCPMCASAIIWSNIKQVYYGCTKNDSDSIGFRDDVIYEYFKGNNKIIDMKNINREECLEVFKKYNGKLY